MAIDIKEITTDALAYLGDSVLELKVREHLVNLGYSSSGHLNKESHKFVTAPAQAAAMRIILPLLSEEEEQIYKRGRNKAGGNVPRSATVSEYRCATGMEVLFGYLHLCGNHSRIEELFCAGFGLDN